MKNSCAQLFRYEISVENLLKAESATCDLCLHLSQRV
jgi:hypothetical protein